MSRRVRDLSLLVDLISGPDGVDLHCKPMKPIGTLPEGDLKGIRVISLPGNGRTKIAPYMKKAILDSARALEERGATIEDREFPRLKKGLEIWSAMLSEHSTHSYDELLTDGAGISWWREVLKLPFRRSAHTFAGLVMVGLDRLLEKLPLPHQQFIEDATLLQQELEEAMGPDGVLLHPSWSKIAPFHHRSWLTPFDFVCTAVFNVLEFPATVVPVAREQGMPVSVQVVGPREGDARTLRVAAALEDAFGPWQQAPVEGL
jgi:fatty acid amide hydrolase 2